MLARVLKQLQVVTKESENRQGVLAAIDVLSKASDESDWLSKYEDDPLKYKVASALCSQRVSKVLLNTFSEH